MTLRSMRRNDLDSVFAIERAVQRFPWSRGNFVDALDSDFICRVDESEDGSIRGYAILMSAADEAELLTIGVAQPEQRKGLGRAILAAMLDEARERRVRRVYLEVRPSNDAAIALYRSAGFDEVGVRRGYYHNASGIEDALVMACELKPLAE